MRGRIEFGCAAASVGAAMALLAGCTSPPVPEPPTSSSTGSPPPVRLTATARQQGAALQIEYRLSNGDGGELFALTRPPTEGWQEGYEGSRPFVTGRGDGLVEVALRAFDVPDGVVREMAARIGAVTVASGASITGAVSAPMPLARHHPYGDDYGRGTVRLPDPIRQVVFCIGVIRSAEARPLPKPTAGSDGALPEGSATSDVTVFEHVSGVTAHQHVICAEPMPLEQP